MNHIFLNICPKRSAVKRRRQREAGFTLMELLIVISIMLILMLIAIPNFSI